SRRYCLARWLDAAPQGSVLHFRSFAKRHLTRKAAPLADPNRCGRVFTLGKSPVLIPRLSRGQKFLSSGHEAVYHAMEIPLTSHGTPGAGLIAVDKIFVGREVELAFLHDRLEETHRGRSRTVLLEGTAGVGKTALLDAFLGRTRHHRVLRIS